MTPQPLQRSCAGCSQVFQPKPFGHNGKYCSGRCRNKVRKSRIPKEVRQEGQKRHYERVKKDPEKYAKHLLFGRNSQRAARLWLADYKITRGCIDCGYKAHFAALQLDHTGIKTASIADIRSSPKRIQEEIDRGQCVVRCANCHAVKTWADKLGIEYTPKMSRHQDMGVAGEADTAKKMC